MIIPETGYGLRRQKGPARHPHRDDTKTAKNATTQPTNKRDTAPQSEKKGNQASRTAVASSMQKNGWSWLRKKAQISAKTHKSKLIKERPGDIKATAASISDGERIYKPLANRVDDWGVEGTGTPSKLPNVTDTVMELGRDLPETLSQARA